MKQTNCRLADRETYDPHRGLLIEIIPSTVHSLKLNIYTLANFFEIVFAFEIECW